MAYCACRMCNGNGLVTLPNRPNLVWKTYRCSHCNATGCDVEATKKLDFSYLFVRSLPLTNRQEQSRSNTNHSHNRSYYIMSQNSPSREAFLNLEHAKLTGNLPDVAIIRNNAHRKSWELREASTLNTEASHPLIKS